MFKLTFKSLVIINILNMIKKFPEFIYREKNIFLKKSMITRIKRRRNFLSVGLVVCSRLNFV